MVSPQSTSYTSASVPWRLRLSGEGQGNDLFFVQRGYCASSLQRDLDMIQRVNRNNVINHQGSGHTDLSRIPLVLTYHLLNARIKRILLSTLNVLSGDLQTKEFFSTGSLSPLSQHPTHTADGCQPGLRVELLVACTGAAALEISILVTAPCRVPNALSSSRMLSSANYLAWCMPSLAAVAPLFTSAKQTVH